MAKKLIRRYLPDAHKIRNHKHLRLFGTLLHDPNLWHLNRRSVAGAFAIGLFMAFVPMPFQMIPAAALAIFYRVNLPIAVALVWITNPATMPPIYYFCYRLGAWVLDTPVQAVEFQISWEWFTTELVRVWKPFLTGSLLVGVICAATGYFGMHALWRWHVIREWERRRLRRTNNKT
ncbi:MAG TPA: DUF2062 domain-containing protein [Sulfuricaulis sp.]|nr:DUF2062 domain-containing protein [Sulfuricaulis sp.]